MVLASESLEFGVMGMGLFGGLALFLFGMEQMTDALKAVAGGGMQKLLAKLTTNRFKAVLTGTVVTAVIQSSSVTTVLVVGFISAGLLTLSQSLGIILGADVGTTITAQVIAFKVTHYALLMIALGFFVVFTVKRHRSRHYGAMLLGLGLVFLGMNLMSDAAKPLRTYQPFIDLMGRMSNPVLGILVGAMFTALIQSSSASMGIIIVLASQGFIGLDAGIALTFGANIGTCVTAGVAAIGRPREAVQAATAHVMYKVAGVGMWMVFIFLWVRLVDPENPLGRLVTWMSPISEATDPMEKLAAETPRQIANAHTVFNVANTFLYIWFTGPMARLLERLLPVKADAPGAPVKPKYLDDNLLDTPALALDRVERELVHLGERAVTMVRSASAALTSGDPDKVDAWARQDDAIDTVYTAVVAHLGKLSTRPLSPPQARMVSEYLAIANAIENIGDTMETDIAHNIRGAIEKGVKPEDLDPEKVHALGQRVTAALEEGLRALLEKDAARAKSVVDAKSEVNGLAKAARERLAQVLGEKGPSYQPTYEVETQLVEYLVRIFHFSRRMSKATRRLEEAYAEAAYEEARKAGEVPA